MARFSVVRSAGCKWNVCDNLQGPHHRCFLYGFQAKTVADSVAREMNRAAKPAPSMETMGLPFERWIILIRSGHADQVADEMVGAQGAMANLLAILAGEE